MSLTGSITIAFILVFLYSQLTNGRYTGWDALGNFLGALMISLAIGLISAIVLSIRARGQIRRILILIFSLSAFLIVTLCWYFYW